MKSRATGSVVRIAAPLRALAQRFSFLLLVLGAVVLLLLGKVDAVLVETLRARVDDAFVPMLDVLSRPAASVARAVEAAQQLSALEQENRRLTLENAALLQWQQVALKLETENRNLRNLLHAVPNPAMDFITARVVADPGGPFVRTVLTTAGRRHGVRKGQAAMAGPGLIGRVIEVGEWSSRVLLITDLNARIPVVMENSRQRAVLSGDNSEMPRLLYTVADAVPQVGERVVTSGHGGTFPPGLPVGKVASVTDRVIKIQPLVDLNRLEMIMLVDYNAVPALSADQIKAGTLP